MRPSTIAAPVSAAICVVTLFLSAPGRAASAANVTPEDVVKAIAECAHGGREIVMSATGAECVDRRAGRNLKTSDVPFGITNLNRRCDDENEKRKLFPEVIKRVVQHALKTAQPIAPSGIRIIGAIFCGALDLEGLDLPHSLVLDHSAFNGHLFGRNLKIRGDFSIDGSFLRWAFNLARSRIEGSFYAENSFISGLMVSDTHIQGSWHQSDALVFDSAIFHALTVVGDLYLDGSALSMLSIEASKIQGGLELTRSEARCAYHIRGNNIGYVYAQDFGFGAMAKAAQLAARYNGNEFVRAGPPGRDRSMELAWWSRYSPLDYAPDDGPSRLPEASVAARLRSPAVQQIALSMVTRAWTNLRVDGLRGCEDFDVKRNAEFYFVNNRVQTDICLRSFIGLETEDEKRTSILSLSGTDVSASASIDLSDRERSRHRRRKHPEIQLEAFGVTIGLLVFNFQDDLDRYALYLDGLRFGQVYDASLKCVFPRTDSKGFTPPGYTIKSKGLERASLPSAQDVHRWLDKNFVSSQPFTAFVTAFENVGADASGLRIVRKTVELCRRTPHWLPFVPCPRGNAADDSGPIAADATASGVGANTLVELPVILFQWMVYPLADHGIRPIKLLYWLFFVLAVFSILFHWVFRIVGFKPKEKDSAGKGRKKSDPPTPWPLGFIFLFDRAVPLYKIREEHYAIDTYFRKATIAEIKGKRSPAGPPYEMRHFGIKSWVHPVTEDENRRAERWLVVLRIIGAILALFLLPAINALITR